MASGADNFSTFLSTLTKGLTAASASGKEDGQYSIAGGGMLGELLSANTEALHKLLNASQIGSAPPAVAPTVLTPADAILVKLAGEDAGLPVSALVVPPITSPGVAMEVVKDMQNFGWVEFAGGKLRLTAEGKNAYQKLVPQAGS
jgi:hypothetical protein